MVTPPEVLEAFRGDQRRPLLRTLVLGILMVAAGSLIAACGLVMRESWALTAGVLVVGTGMLCTLLRLRRLLLDSTSLAVRRDGLFVQHPDGREELIGWGDLAAVRHDAHHDRVLLELREGPPRAIEYPLDGITARELARRLDRWRLREGLGMLRGC